MSAQSYFNNAVENNPTDMSVATLAALSRSTAIMPNYICVNYLLQLPTGSTYAQGVKAWYDAESPEDEMLKNLDQDAVTHGDERVIAWRIRAKACVEAIAAMK